CSTFFPMSAWVWSPPHHVSAALFPTPGWVWCPAYLISTALWSLCLGGSGLHHTMSVQL
ncbi:hypothetical protein NDU88_000076, partial [Pleurodeles waltl]